MKFYLRQLIFKKIDALIILKKSCYVIISAIAIEDWDDEYHFLRQTTFLNLLLGYLCAFVSSDCIMWLMLNSHEINVPE